jgi:hypothetical protein
MEYFEFRAVSLFGSGFFSGLANPASASSNVSVSQLYLLEKPLLALFDCLQRRNIERI